MLQDVIWSLLCLNNLSSDEYSGYDYVGGMANNKRVLDCPGFQILVMPTEIVFFLNLIHLATVVFANFHGF